MLTGGDGIDYFLMNEVPDGVNVDTIVDFEQGVDKIGIRSANSAPIFAAIGETLDAGEVANGAAQDADDFILYDAVTGLVSYDADGNGAGGAFAFVRLATLPASLSVSDFGVDVFPNI
jgi:Ca2+-binding RTX toxin-like protein